MRDHARTPQSNDSPEMTIETPNWKGLQSVLFLRAIETGFPVLFVANAWDIFLDVLGGQFSVVAGFRDRFLNCKLSERDCARLMVAVHAEWEMHEPWPVSIRDLWPVLCDWRKHAQDRFERRRWRDLVDSGDFPQAVRYLIEIGYWTEERAFRITNLGAAEIHNSANERRPELIKAKRRDRH